MSDRKAVIKNADMSEEMQQDAVDCATQVSQGLKGLPTRVVDPDHFGSASTKNLHQNCLSWIRNRIRICIN
jgi:hypothetical protein